MLTFNREQHEYTRSARYEAGRSLRFPGMGTPTEDTMTIVKTQEQRCGGHWLPEEMPSENTIVPQVKEINVC
jgi:hypothetical protein